jgi:hypothetical protein
MANVSSPFGFRQYRGNGSAPTFEQVYFNMDYNAGACFFGDPVTLQADGTVAVSVSTGATPGTLGIAGIFVGCKYASVSQKRTVWSNYWPGSDVASGNFVTAYIVNDPNAQFLVQTDSTGAALVDVNATVGFQIGTGNTANGISGAYLDISTLNTASYVANNPFRIVGILQEPPNSPGTLAQGQPYDNVIVAFNNAATRNLQGV